MKRRFAVTLLAVAIASFCTSAFAVAPTIFTFRSPVIADDTPVTNSNIFVYPDVFNLDNKAHDSDNTTTDGGLKWSFLEASGTYTINGVPTMNLATDDPNNPGAKEIGRNEADDPDSVDSNTRTITFRNAALTPTDATAIDPVTVGVLPTQTKAMTLFASDGSSYSQTTFMVYTENNGADHLSGAGLTPVLEKQTFTTAFGWTSAIIASSTGLSMAISNGLCINTPADGDNFAEWISPYGIIPLAKNQVYRIRMTVATNPAVAADTTPFWDLVIDNFGPTAPQQQNRYSGDYFFWDNYQGANAAGLTSPQGRHTFDIWYTPGAVTAEDWNATDGEFAAANDANNDVRLQFRVLDVRGPNGGGSGAIDGEHDAGNLCMSDIQIDRIDIADLTVASTPFDHPVVNTATFGATSSVFTGSTNFSFGTDGLTITPTNGTSWDLELVTVDVGDSNVDFNVPSTVGDNWPIAWSSDQLLVFTAGVSAASNAVGNGETNPPDVIRMGMDTATNEILSDCRMSSGQGVIGMPKVATTTEYKTLFYTHNKTLSTTPQFAGLRPRFALLNNQEVLSAGSLAHNTGGVVLKSERVDVIDSSGL